MSTRCPSTHRSVLCTDEFGNRYRRCLICGNEWDVLEATWPPPHDLLTEADLSHRRRTT